jgi:hypothetical protein
MFLADAARWRHQMLRLAALCLPHLLQQNTGVNTGASVADAAAAATLELHATGYLLDAAGWQWAALLPPEQRAALDAQLMHFGQTPPALFSAPHPPRSAPAPPGRLSSTPLFAYGRSPRLCPAGRWDAGGRAWMARGGATVRAGGDTWFFMTADYAFGHALERDTSAFVRAAGGRVVGSVRTPFPGTTDFSSFLLQAQASRAKVIGLANAGVDTINSIKQAAEFGITRRGVKIASLLLFITDVHALGLEVAQGLVCANTFYWDANDQTRGLTRRIRAIAGGDTPVAMSHAGDYAGTLHYLKAVADMGVANAKASGRATVERMKAMPTQDDAFGAGSIRADGRKLHPAYLYEVKTPAESRHQHDYYKLLQTSTAEEAFRPLAEGGCPLIRT